MRFENVKFIPRWEYVGVFVLQQNFVVEYQHKNEKKGFPNHEGI